MTYMDFLHAAIDPGLPVHHPASFGRYDVAAHASRFQGGAGTSTQIVEGAQPSPAGSMVPFRRATTGRTTTIEQTSLAAVTANEQPIEIQVEGSGYVYGIDVEFDIETDSNAATVAFHEDAPWNVISSIVYSDVNGQLVNLPGYSLHLLNLYGGHAIARDEDSTDETIFEQITGVGAGRGGSVHAHLWVPIGLNRRTLLGIVGNQSQNQKYQLRTNVNGSGQIYTTPPTNAGAVQIDRTYHNYAVPQGENANKQRQQTEPPKFGVLSFATQIVSTALPTDNSTRNHFLGRIGNTIRLLGLVFRDGNGASARADAEANLPTQLQFQLGDTPLFTEGVGARRREMRQRYGFDAPNGVLIYDWITDIVQRAGAELGDDYLFTEGLNNAQFQVTYGAGWAANSSLTIITSDLIVPPGVNLYS